MEIEYKGIDLRIDTVSFKEEKLCSIIYYEGENVTEIFEKLDLIEDINQELNK